MPSHQVESRWLVLIVALFIALGIFYSNTTPVFEAPDENWHYAYVREIAVDHAFPVVVPSEKQAWAQEGSQAPLYYTLGAAIVGWIDARDLANTPALNPFARIGEPAAASNDNRNAFLHNSDEAFPYRGASLAVHLLRLSSVLLGAATVVLTYGLAREVFPDRSIIALAAAAFVAFLPQFVFISSAINNDNLATTLTAATLWQLARMMRRGLTNKRAAIVGILIGSALLTKFNTVTLIPLAVLVILIVSAPKREWRALVRSSAIVIVIAVLIAGWWYIRNGQLYGDPTALSLVLSIIGERPAPITLLRWFAAENEGLRLSTWGVFGWMSILASPTFYTFFDALAVIGIVGMAAAIFRRRKLSLGIGVLALWCVVTFAALVSYNLSITASQGRLLFTALPAYAALWAWGITSLVPARLTSWVTIAMGGAQAFAALVAPMAFIAPAYAPTVIAENALPSNATRLDLRFSNGSDWLATSVNQATVQPGGTVTVTLYQRLPAPSNRAAAEFVHLVNSAGVIVAQRDSLIGMGNPGALPSSGIAVDSYRLLIPITAPAPDPWRVEVGLYDPANYTRFTITDGTGKSLGDAVTLTTLRAESSSKPWNLDFDGRTTLITANLDGVQVARGATLQVQLRWSAAPKSYHVFVHALGDQDHIWAAADSPLSRDMQIELKFDPETPAGIYPLELGVYPENGDRLAVYDAKGQPIGDRIFVGAIRVID
ncbi:MAG TPA: glycosyltransferase family 39 protein [Anaerolineae bacterium]